jgi:multidrug efflux pump
VTLIDAALNRSRTVVATLLLLLVAGTYAYMAIPKESDPDVNMPVVYTLMTHEGISPEDAERLLVRPMEQEMRSIEGIKEMRSEGMEGAAYVLIEFDAGFDADQAMEDVREKVDLAKPELPTDTDEPRVHEVNLSQFPVLVVTLSGEVPERTLLRLARVLQDKIEAVPSVLEAKISGDREEVVEIVIDPLLLESYGINPAAAAQMIGRSNRLIAAGAVDTGQGRFSIKVPAVFETVDDIFDLPITTQGDAVVRVRDVAKVRRTFKDPESFARLNGQRAIGLDISKRAGENIIDTIERVRGIVETERANWPAGVEVTYTQDKSVGIRDMLRDLQNNVISAVLLVMIVVVAALGLRSAGLVGLAIPGSFLTGILVIYALGLTVNIVVLFSLILAVGMLVDGAIVVTEYADRMMAEGRSKRAAYAQAAKRMAWPIIASTATTLAAFMPLLFWPGIVGEFMKFLPITLMATLSASLLMALVFVPTVGAIFGKAGSANAATLRALADDAKFDADAIPGLTGVYTRGLRRALRHPGLVLGLAVAMLVGVQWYYATHGNGVEFFPDVEPEAAQLHVHARGNLSVHEQDKLLREVEAEVLKLDDFKAVYAVAGGREATNTDKAQDVIGTVFLEFKPWDERRKASVVMADILERTTPLAGITVEPRKQEAGPPIGKPIHVQLASAKPDLLPAAAATVRKRMEGMAGLVDIEDSGDIPGIDWELKVDRAQAAKFGADVSAVGDAIQFVTKGLKVGEYRPDDTDEELDIVVRYSEGFRSVGQLDTIKIATDQGMVPISNFVRREPKAKVGNIKRVDGNIVMDVKADIADGVLADSKTRELRSWIETEAGLDPRIDVTFKGEDEEAKAAEAFLMKAFIVALFIMAIILVTQFNSFYSAFLILSAVIMSTIGVMLGLMVTGEPFGIVMTGVGVIALAGIVVNNNIVLIDTFDQLRKTVSDPVEAILRTGAQRLRPVFLTTVTTILGLMPMVLRLNIDFVTREVAYGAPSTQWWVQLASAVAFGLAFATVLTLVVTPSALMLRENVRARRARKARAKAGAAPAASPAE